MTIKGLGYVVVKTAVPEAWDRFLLDVVGTMRAENAPEGVSLHRIDERPFRFWIETGDRELLAAAAYEVGDGSELATLKKKIAGCGRPVDDGSTAEAMARGVSAFFRTSDPAGNGLEFYHGETRDERPFVPAVQCGGFVTGEMGMGHAVLAAPNFGESHKFYNDIGFHDSDVPRFRFSEDEADPGMGFAFMHADNGRHHSLAVCEMPLPPSGCVHLMLEMKSISDVGKCHDRMRSNGVPESATLGRHVNDQTFGFYMQTPSGFDLEIGADPLVIDPKTWSPTAHLMPSEWGHQWAWQKALEQGEKP